MELFLSKLLEPVGLIWLLSWAGLIVAVRKKQWHSAVSFGVLASFIWLAGSRLSTYLLASLEKPYEHLRVEDAPQCDAVVMLGGVLKQSEHDAFAIDFGEGTDRAVTALELLRCGKAQALVLGGGGGRDRKTGVWQEGTLLQVWAKAWGIATTNLITLRFCATTHDEALLVRELAQEHHWQRVLLVTSAYHMKRAEGLFRRQGISTVPMAADFLASSELALDKPFNFVPEFIGFKHLRLFLHEKIGWMYYSLRHRVE